MTIVNNHGSTMTTRKDLPEHEDLVLGAPLREELHLFLAKHGKASMLTTVVRAGFGATVADLSREGSALGGDARVVENLVVGRLVYAADTWKRRTARAARRVIEHQDDLSPELARNARAVLDAVELLG